MPNAPRTYKPPWAAKAAKQTSRQYDKKHEEDRSFYWSTAWRKFRKWFLARHPLCEWCMEQGVVTAANEVDHRIPRRDRQDLALDEGNCRAACKSCHARYGAKASERR